jgi:3-hydroxybutyryl-CoA dehydrogenase
MGHGIAQLAAMSGIAVTVIDVDGTALERAQTAVSASLDKLVTKSRLTEEDAQSALQSLSWSPSLEAGVEGAEFVIEAVPESLELKRKVFAELTRVTDSNVVLASNTSQLSITSIGAGLEGPDRIVGMHFFNPPVLMKLVEIVQAVRTSDQTLERTKALSEQLGKESIVCLRDTPGFITTRAIMALRLECIRMWEEGVASMEDLDKAMRLGFNHPMGQFELNDFNGLDIALEGARSLREAYGERFAPPASLVAKVNAGQLGRKTGSGWYEYGEVDR